MLQVEIVTMLPQAIDAIGGTVLRRLTVPVRFFCEGPAAPQRGGSAFSSVRREGVLEHDRHGLQVQGQAGLITGVQNVTLKREGAGLAEGEGIELPLPTLPVTALHALPSPEVPAIVAGSAPVVGRALSVKSRSLGGKGRGHEDPLVVADRPVRPGPRW